MDYKVLQFTLILTTAGHKQTWNYHHSIMTDWEPPGCFYPQLALDISPQTQVERPKFRNLDHLLHCHPLGGAQLSVKVPAWQLRGILPVVPFPTAIYFIKGTGWHLLNVKENLSSLQVCEISLSLQAPYQSKTWDLRVASSPMRSEIYTIIYDIRNCGGQNYNWLNCPVVIPNPKFRKSTSWPPNPLQASPIPSHLSGHFPVLGTKYTYPLSLSQYIFFKKGSENNIHKASETQ